MRVQKRTLLQMQRPYAVLSLPDGAQVIASAEDHGATYAFSPPGWEPVEILPGPGGCMALCPAPAAGRRLYAIMQCFPGYQFHEAGIYLLEGGIGKPGWSQRRLFDLPFAHRLEIVQKHGQAFLVAATLAATKRSREDWAEPGSVYAAPISERAEGSPALVPILTGLHKNHGLLVSALAGDPVLLVCAQEGVFLHRLRSCAWDFERILNNETSELQLLDLDGDGQAELISIEPFHGNALKVYRQAHGAWQQVCEQPLDYGHGLWAGTVRGRKTVIVSNRSGTRDLCLFTMASAGGWKLDRQTIDTGAGAANVSLIASEAADLVFSTNQATGEVACYAISEL